MLLSGFRASIIMEDGKSLDEAKVKAALDKARLELVSITEEKIATPDHAYMLTATGAG